MFLIDQSLIDALDQRVVEPVYFVYMDTPDGKIYAHTGVGPISYLNEVWHGMGIFGSIGSVECNDNIGSHTVNLQLSGIDPMLLTQVTTKNLINREVELHYGALDEQGKLISASPYFYGRVSSTNLVRYDKDSITVQAVSKTSDWSKNKADRYTDESHRSRHPGDDFFQYIKQMSQRDLNWGVDKDNVPLVPRNQQQ